MKMMVEQCFTGYLSVDMMENKGTSMLATPSMETLLYILTELNKRATPSMETLLYILTELN